MKALNECEDRRLYFAMNLSFACSLRMGEILGLTWGNVPIIDEEIANDNAWIYVVRNTSVTNIIYTKKCICDTFFFLDTTLTDTPDSPITKDSGTNG